MADDRAAGVPQKLEELVVDDRAAVVPRKPEELAVVDRVADVPQNPELVDDPGELAVKVKVGVPVVKARTVVAAKARMVAAVKDVPINRRDLVGSVGQ